MICSRKGYNAEGRDARERDARAHPAAAHVRRGDRLLATAPRAQTARSRWRSRWPRTTPRYYMPYQYGNPANPAAHYNGTALEILEELDEVAAFVAGLGTGGTLMGNGRRLKEALGDSVKIVAAEPMQGEPVQGLRSLDDGFIPPIIDLSLLDRKIFVTNRDAITWTRRLLDEEGIFAGVSSRRDRPRRGPHRGRAGRGQRRLHRLRRRLEVPLSGHLHAAGGRDREPRLHRLVVEQAPKAEAPEAMNISPELLGELVAHVQEDPGNECCGCYRGRPRLDGDRRGPRRPGPARDERPRAAR